MGSPDSSSFASGTFPHKNPTLPFWRTQLHELDDHRSTEELPESCDILIIGGGYAGIAAAYHLLCGHESSNNPRPSIVLAEVRQACSGATGRNGTFNPPSLLVNVYIPSKQADQNLRWSSSSRGLPSDPQLHQAVRT